MHLAPAQPGACQLLPAWPQILGVTPGVDEAGTDLLLGTAPLVHRCHRLRFGMTVPVPFEEIIHSARTMQVFLGLL